MEAEQLGAERFDGWYFGHVVDWQTYLDEARKERESQEWLELNGWRWGQHIDWDYDADGNRFVDGYFGAWSKVCVDGVEHIAFDADQARETEQKAMARVARRELARMGVMTFSPATGVYCGPDGYRRYVEGYNIWD